MNLPTIIISVILVIIICIGNRSTKKRATSGCCGSSEATSINDNLNMYINDHLRMYTSDYALI